MANTMQQQTQPPPSTLVPLLVHSMLRQPGVFKGAGAQPRELRLLNRLAAARRRLSATANKLLVEATGNHYAVMVWTLHEAAGVQKIIFRYGVELEGWPAGMRLQSPGRIGSVRRLEQLRMGFERGAIRFRNLAPAEIAHHQQQALLANFQLFVPHPAVIVGPVGGAVPAVAAQQDEDEGEEEDNIEEAVWSDDE